MLLLQQFLFLVVASPQSPLVVQMVLLKETQGNRDRIVKEAPLRKRALKEQCAEIVSRGYKMRKVMLPLCVQLTWNHVETLG